MLGSFGPREAIRADLEHLLVHSTVHIFVESFVIPGVLIRHYCVGSFGCFFVLEFTIGEGYGLFLLVFESGAEAGLRSGIDRGCTYLFE